MIFNVSSVDRLKSVLAFHGKSRINVKIIMGIAAVFFLCRISAAAENTVAVMPFVGPDTTAQSQERGLRIAERLSSFIAQSRQITLVERIQIEKAYRETKLGQSGAITESSAAEAGKMIGAAYVIVGSFSFEGVMEAIQARIVNIETGIVIGSVIKDGSKESDIIDAVAIKLLDHLGIRTSFNTSYNVKRSLMWISGIAALGCGGTAVWSHGQYTTADEKYRTAVNGSAADFTTFADKAQFFSNARWYFAGGATALLGTGIVLFIYNKSAWKFERKKTVQGTFAPLISPNSIGLSYTVNLPSISTGCPLQ